MTELSEGQIVLPSQLPRPENAVVFWTIFDHPKDYAVGYVLRAGFVIRGCSEPQISSAAWYAASPDLLEAILPSGVTRIGPQESDDPVILSVWME